MERRCALGFLITILLLPKIKCQQQPEAQCSPIGSLCVDSKNCCGEATCYTVIPNSGICLSDNALTDLSQLTEWLIHRLKQDPLLQAVRQKVISLLAQITDEIKVAYGRSF